VWLILYLASGNSGYVIAGIAGCITGIFGFYQFRLLMVLKEQVETLTKLNANFKRENSAIIKEVHNLESASIQLRSTQDRLRQSTEKQKENIENLTELNKNLSTMGGSNSESMTRIQDMSKKMVSKWKEELYKHERQLLVTVYERHEFKDNEEGLQEDEYKEFLEALPADYKARFQEKGSFKELADSNGIIHYDKFKEFLDQMGAHGEQHK